MARHGAAAATAAAVAVVEVVYALSASQAVVRITLPPEGLTALRACELSGLFERFPEIRQRPLVLGVYGEICRPDRVLKPGDRVEIYRPLPHDPRAARRERVASQAAAPKHRKR